MPALLAELRGERAALSMWSQRYLLALVPPVLAAALASDRAPCLALETAGAVLGPDGLPEAACLPDPDRRGRADLPGDLLRAHLVPLAARFAAAGLPPSVFWSNAGYVVSWTLRTVRAPRAADLLLKLQSPFWFGAPNPLPPAARAVLAEGGRAVCCLRFRLPDMARCPECPLLCRGRVAAVAP